MFIKFHVSAIREKTFSPSFSRFGLLFMFLSDISSKIRDQIGTGMPGSQNLGLFISIHSVLFTNKSAQMSNFVASFEFIGANAWELEFQSQEQWFIILYKSIRDACDDLSRKNACMMKDWAESPDDYSCRSLFCWQGNIFQTREENFQWSQEMFTKINKLFSWLNTTESWMSNVMRKAWKGITNVSNYCWLNYFPSTLPARAYVISIVSYELRHFVWNMIQLLTQLCLLTNHQTIAENNKEQFSKLSLLRQTFRSLCTWLHNAVYVIKITRVIEDVWAKHWLKLWNIFATIKSTSWVVRA